MEPLLRVEGKRMIRFVSLWLWVRDWKQRDSRSFLLELQMCIKAQSIKRPLQTKAEGISLFPFIEIPVEYRINIMECKPWCIAIVV